MAGAMRKMAVYLGLVEDDGYDGRGFDPDDDFEPEPEPEREHRRHQPVASAGKGRTGARRPTTRAARARPASLAAETGRPARIAPVASITPERRTWRRTHR